MDETIESLDRVMARGRVDIDEFVKEEAVATLEVVSQARLVARVFKPKEEEEGSNKVFALLTSDSEFPHKNPSGNHNFMVRTYSFFNLFNFYANLK